MGGVLILRGRTPSHTYRERGGRRHVIDVEVRVGADGRRVVDGGHRDDSGSEDDLHGGGARHGWWLVWTGAREVREVR